MPPGGDEHTYCPDVRLSHKPSTFGFHLRNREEDMLSDSVEYDDASVAQSALSPICCSVQAFGTQTEPDDEQSSVPVAACKSPVLTLYF